jgi:hypothetical protein
MAVMGRTRTRRRPAGEPRSTRRPGWSEIRIRRTRSPPDQMFEKLKPFKDRVAEDIREESS